ncbi:MAG: hypothetical protein ACKVS8_09705 [Phycisphaerales bacterium]
MNTRLSLILLSLLAGSIVPVSSAALAQPAGAAAAQAVGAAQNDLPITQVLLYRSGVAAFQRDGRVDGNARLALKFEVSQINDILKSLQVLDKGGRVESVTYSSKDPLARRLGSFGVPIGDDPSLATLLGRLRGSVVRVSMPEGEITGTVLGVETRLVSSTKDSPPVSRAFVNLVTAKGIRSIDSTLATSFQLEDAALAEELNKALAAVAESRSERSKSVDVAVSGSGTRDVIIRYIHETPVWKTSYRLLLPEGNEAKAPASDQFNLQGWAIVENTTDSDWRDVSLSLVAGRPVSFTMDLSEPLYVFRPNLPVPTVPGVLARAYEEAMAPVRQLASDAMGGQSVATEAWRRESAPARTSRFGKAASAPADRAAAMPASAAVEVSADDLLNYSPSAAARGTELGESFFYKVSAPITIERQRSAMIPFLTSPVGGRRVSIYNRIDRPEHPMRGVEITNSSDLQLLPGPIAVYDGAIFAGDATISHLPPGDKRLLAYAVDLDIKTRATPEATDEITKIRIVDGAFEVTNLNRMKMLYRFDNNDKKRARTVIVEHPKNSPYKLVGDLKATEDTPSNYRFEVSIDAGKSTELVVNEEWVRSQQVGLSGYSMPDLVRLSKNGKVSNGVLDAVRTWAQKNAAAEEAQRELAQLDERGARSATEQERISQVMQRVPNNSEVYANYMKDLNQAANEGRAIKGQREAAVAKATAAMRDRDDFLRNLKVD